MMGEPIEHCLAQQRPAAAAVEALCAGSSPWMKWSRRSRLCIMRDEYVN
jgi:hypothetical protein